MQKITSYDNIYQHPIFTDMNHLYSVLSSKHQNRDVLFSRRINDCLQPIIDVFERYTHVMWDVAMTPEPYEKIKVPKSSKKAVLLAFSGGKDSTATAIWLKEHGYDVTLYHLVGINKTYKDEHWTAGVVAEKLGLPIVFGHCYLSGNHDYVEHPMKNMMIANAMLQYGLQNKLTHRIAFGNFSTSTLEDDPFEVCGGDDREMWQIYTDCIRHVIPSFQIMTPLANMKDTLDILLQKPDIAVLCQSCIGPYRYRDYLHRNNVRKYGVQLRDKRCGSCWKCCLEYCVYADNDIYEYNEEYYKHCLDILRKTLLAEAGIKATREEAWEHYFFYDKSESKYFKKLLTD